MTTAIETDFCSSYLSRQRALNSPPGAELQYNNGGYVLLAIIVKRVSGQSLATLPAPTSSILWA